MKSVLVIGGYGGFGARLTRRLSNTGWQVLVAGRNLNTATAFCKGVPNAKPIQADRMGDLLPLLHQLRPDLVIDAAGPFQNCDYRVPIACIDAGIPYLDLADARDFVCGIGALDARAKAAGIAIVSGASSVPALSGAVIRHLSGGVDKVTAVNMAISASNRATAGPSVSAAILSYVGRTIPLWRGGRWQNVAGWSLLRREWFAVSGRRTLNRLTALSDVPDHSLLPMHHPDKPATTFRAGPEFSFQVLGLWVLSWPVRWGWTSSLSGMSNWLRYLQAPTNKLGSDRSGMVVEVKGFIGEEAVVRRWTLIAEDGDGPEIPTLAAVILAQMMASGEIMPSARDASGLLTLDQFAPQFADLAIYHETTSQPYVPLYRTVMGEALDTLPAPVVKLHNLVGSGGAIGSAQVTRGTSWLAGLVCAAMAFPPAGDTPLHVSFEEHNGAETWTRDFNGKRFKSMLAQRNGQLTESFGPLTFTFDLTTDNRCLNMRIISWTAFGIPLPLWLSPTSVARESGDGEDFCFDVSIDLPLIGRVVRYEGRLRPI
jgi:NAD(P)-dependent dehydrogenase (short-subunit alcohol dehydrogenase family)